MTLPSLTLLAALAAPQIELYTMGQGSHVFERFGHAALCVVERGAPARAQCYNYGTTDFGSPPAELGWEFLKGTSRFWVSVWPRDRMLRAYERADRSVWRQILPLTPEQARAVADKLSHDALPENRYYTYHHFDENCSTRLRDIIDEATGGVLQRGGTEPLGITYRELGRDALAGVTPALLAADLWIGRRADSAPTLYQGAFLPTILREQVARRFGVTPEPIYRRRGAPFPERAGSNWPIFAGASLALTAPLLATGRRGPASRVRRVAIAMVALVLGLIGSVTWFVALVSAVPELRVNEALAAFWPTDFALAVLPAGWRRSYATLRLLTVLLTVVLVAVGLFRQPLLASVLLVGLPSAVLALERCSGEGRRAQGHDEECPGDGGL